MSTQKNITSNSNSLIIGKDYYPNLKKNLGFKTFKKPIPLKYKIATNNQDVKTKEGVVMANKGDFIMT